MALGHFLLATGHPAVFLDGYPVGANGDRAFCSECRRELREGHRATVHAYRVEVTNQWDVPGVYCDVCSPSRIAEPTPGAVEVLATGKLVSGEAVNGESPRLHFVDVDVTRYNGPDGDTA